MGLDLMRWDMGLFGGGKKKGGGGLSIQDPPPFQTDANLGWSQDRLKGQADYLLNGLTQDGGGLSGMLGDTVSLNPKITQLAIQNLQAQLEPSYRQSRQNLTNTLEANNQLTGSTTGNQFGNLESDYLAQLTAAGAQASMADINRALQNRVSLYGTGLNTAQAVGSAALQNQAQMNQFALSNYENQVSQALLNQPTPTGGLTGALTGALGGAIAGGTIAGPYGAIAGAGLGGFSGYNGQPGTGGQFLGAGAGMYGASRPLQLMGLGNGGTALSNVNTGESIQQTILNSNNPYSYLGKYGLLSAN